MAKKKQDETAPLQAEALLELGAVAGTLRERARGAINTLEQAIAAWDTLTPAQKDNATRLSIRVVVALARMQARELDKAGS